MTVTASAESHSTLGALLELYRPRLGGRSGTGDTLIIQWINAGVDEIARDLPPQFLLATFSISVTSGTAAYDLDSSTYIYNDLVQGTVKLTDSASDETTPVYVHPHLWTPMKVADDGDASACAYYSVLPQTLSSRRQVELYDTPDAAYTLAGQYIYRPGRLAAGQETTAIPLPIEAQSVLEYYLDWRVEQHRKTSAGDIDRTMGVYENKRMELSHALYTSSMGRVGHVEAQTPDYVVGAMDYQNL